MIVTKIKDTQKAEIAFSLLTNINELPFVYPGYTKGLNSIFSLNRY